MEGLFQVSIASDGTKRTLDQLKTGAVVGEMSFLEDRNSAVEVNAIEPSRVLSLSKQVLSQRLELDLVFAADLYKAIALVLSSRLRNEYKRSTKATPAESSAKFPAWHDFSALQ